MIINKREVNKERCIYCNKEIGIKRGYEFSLDDYKDLKGIHLGCLKKFRDIIKSRGSNSVIHFRGYENIKCLGCYLEIKPGDEISRIDLGNKSYKIHKGCGGIISGRIDSLLKLY